MEQACLRCQEKRDREHEKKESGDIMTLLPSYGSMADLTKIAARVAEGRVRTAGTIEFKKDQGPIRREVRAKGFEWSSDSLKDLAKVLWAAQRAHSFGIAAYRVFSQMQSSDFSPDGLLGGKGYIQSIKEMRGALSNSVEALSSFCDTIHDEVNAEHWSQIGEGGEEVQEIVKDAEDIKEDPESFVDSEYPSGSFEDDEEDDPSEMNPDPSEMNPEVSEEDEDDEDDEDDDSQSTQLSSDVGDYSTSFLKAVRTAAFEPVIDESNIDGPRAFPIGPAEGGEFGDFNPDTWPLDENMEELLLEWELPCGSPNPTDGDLYKSVASRVSTSILGYSWLPGANNNRQMNIYARGLTEEDRKWAEANDKPPLPPGMEQPRRVPISDPLWKDW